MTQINFRFQWMDDTQRAMVYLAQGEWTWRDYHAIVRASTFSMFRGEGLIESVIDVRGGTRTEMPRGLPAHMRSFGKKNHTRLSGRAVVIGMPQAYWAELQLDEDHSLSTPDGYVKFVQSDEELQAVLADWYANPPE